MKQTRKKFLKTSLCVASGLVLAGGASKSLFSMNRSLDFQISLAQYSLHRALFGGELDNLDFPAKAVNDFGIHAVEYVNQFFPDKAEDMDYLSELKQRTDDLGVRNVLIMIDREGELSSPDKNVRLEAVKNHYKWVDAAKYLGCHSIRVNLFGADDEDDWISASIDGLGRLSEYGKKNEIAILVENHGGYSSNAGLLAQVMDQVHNEWVGTLPDFGNFCIRRQDGETWGTPCVEEYDTYKGVEEMMPYAKGVSAKTYAFDENGKEATLDFTRIFNIIEDSGFSGFVGIEYEGDSLPEDEGIKATHQLLKRIQKDFK